MNPSYKGIKSYIRENKNTILNIITSLSFGFIIYVIFRSNSIFNLIDKNLSEIWGIPNWIKYNLPDGLWLFSLNSTILLIWKNQRSLPFVFWIAFSTSLSIIIEYLQKYRIVTGTFDKYDILAYIISLITFVFLLEIRKISQKRKP